jgi:hypothetical protein
MRAVVSSALGLIGITLASFRLLAGDWSASTAIGLLVVGIAVTGAATLRSNPRNRKHVAEAGLSLVVVGLAVLALSIHRWPWAAVGLVFLALYLGSSCVRLLQLPFRTGGPARPEWRLLFWVLIPGIAIAGADVAAIAGTRIQVIETALSLQCAVVVIAPWAAEDFPLSAARLPTLFGIAGLTFVAVAGIVFAGATVALLVLGVVSGVAVGMVTFGPDLGEDTSPGVPVTQSYGTILFGWLLTSVTLLLVIGTGIAVSP